MRVVLSGYYGFGNIGDEALLSGLITGLQYYGHTVRVLSNAPKVTETEHHVRASHRYYELVQALMWCDAVISGGGGLLQDRTSHRSLHYYLGVLRLAGFLNKKRFVYGQSIGPLSNEGRKLLKRHLSEVPIAVRDMASQSLLSEMGLGSHVVADSALLLPKPSSAASISAPLLIIPRAGYPDIQKTLKALVLHLKKEREPIAFLALHPDEDGAYVRELAQEVPEARVMRVSTPLEALHCIAGARAVLSVRLHGLILAAVAQKPFNGLVYDPKVAAFLQEAGIEALHSDELLEKPIQQLYDRFGYRSAHIAQLQSRAREGMAWLQQQVTVVL